MNILISSNKKMVPTYVGMALGVGMAVTAVSWVCFFALIFPLGLVHGMPRVALGFAVGIPMIVSAFTLPFFLLLVSRTPVRALGRYHWVLMLSAIFAVIGFVAVFNMPKGAHTLVKLIYVFVAVYFFSSGALMYAVTHFKLAMRISADRSELDKLNLFWLAVTAVATVTAVASMIFWVPVDRQNILNITFLAGTIMLLAGITAFFGTYNYLPRIEIKEIGLAKQHYPKEVISDFKSISGNRNVDGLENAGEYIAYDVNKCNGISTVAKRLFLTGIAFCLFALFFCAVLALPILFIVAERTGLFGYTPQRGGLVFALIGIVFFALIYFLGIKFPPKSISNAAKRCCFPISLCAGFFTVLLFISMFSGTVDIMAVFAGFVITPVIGACGGLAISAISAHWTFLNENSKTKIAVENKQILSYISVTIVAGLAVIFSGAAMSLAGSGRHAWVVYVGVAVSAAVIGIILLVAASKNNTKRIIQNMKTDK